MKSATVKKQPAPKYVATRNGCKLCAPFGACLAFRGMEGAVPFLHGSQGCATYMRRYTISHFKEPMDIAASNFNETSAVFGGRENFNLGLRNVTAQYRPQMIGIATTCLSETIGEDVNLMLREYQADAGDQGPTLVPVSTPSYRGTHMDGFHGAVKAAVDTLAEGGAPGEHINLFPGMVSPADLRYLKEILAGFGLSYVLLPDYSVSLDGPALDTYQKLPAGGTSVEAIRSTGRARGTIECGRTLVGKPTAGALLKQRFAVPCQQIGLPIGVNATDLFFASLETISGRATPAPHQGERGRLVDAYVDGHKYVFGKRCLVYGEEDLVIGLAGFLSEIGAVPALCGSGGESGQLAAGLREVTADAPGEVLAREGVDFLSLAEEARPLHLDFVIGNSKGYALARELGIPLVRVGFPIHDRVGGARILHLGYRGAQQLFDRVVNALIEHKQDTSPVGYSYM
jgi:nitrogenase molybdenum-iron protein NifN